MAKTQVLIEGNLVKILETTEVRQVSLDDFLPLLTTRQAIHIPALPHNLSHLGVDPHQDGSSDVDVVIECAPQPRNVEHGPDAGPHHFYRVAMPWTYFIFHVKTDDPNLRTGWACGNWTVWWSREKVVDINKKVLHRVRLPNTYDDGRICFGNLGRAGNNTLADFVDGTVAVFWVSKFNNHLTWPWPKDYKNWKDWVDDTARSEACWETWPELREEGRALKDLLRNPADRYAPIIMEGTIPEVPMPLTFDQIDRWATLIGDAAKERVRDYFIGAGQHVLRPRTAR